MTLPHRLPAQALPVIAEADAAVVGGSFAGLACAAALARNGKKVIVIEQRTYLGRELTASLRPWLELSADDKAQHALPESIRYCLERNERSQDTPLPGHTPLYPDPLKRSLEDWLEAHGIELLYATLPIGLCERDGRAEGLIVANKSGRQVVRCQAVIDATETALVAALCGEDVSRYSKGDRAGYVRTLEFIDVGELEEAALTVPEELKLNGNKLRLRQGYRGKGHVFVEFILTMDSANSLNASRDREIEARHLGMRLAIHLINNVPAFHKAVFSNSSFDLLGPFPEGTEQSLARRESVSISGESVAVSGVSGVWSLFMNVYRNGNTALFDAVQAARIGERLGEELLSRQLIPIAAEASRTAERHVAESAFPLLGEVEVLVAGGGTSGACASITAAKEKMKTMLLDLNPGLGGTGTFGGVDSYWFGRRVGYAERINEAVLKVQQELRYKGAKWNIEAKMYALLEEAHRSGVDLQFNVLTFGALRDGNRVTGAVIATRWGPFAVRSETVIDATGDGDVAAFAGAEFVYGSEKDHTVMWYSLAQFTTPAKVQNNFTSMVDMSDVLDYTRAILAGRRRGTDCHDHGIYVATRESRHIMGDVVMQLSDQLLHRSWPDLVNIHFSNHDVKGVSGADWINIGLIPPNLEIEIPYRMLLPQGLEGILVAGKAVSATHDALPAIRMQSDLENLGAVAALAAALAVRGRTTPRHIDVKRLQSRLIEEKLLPHDVLTRELAPLIYTDAALEELAASIEAEQPLYEYSNMRMNEIFRRNIPFVEICSAGPRIEPYLIKELETAQDLKRIRLAQALAMLESQAGVPVLIEAIMAALQGPELPRRTADIMYVQLPPDHGAMPDIVYYLYSLGQTKDRRSIPVWQRVVDLLQPSEDDFKDTWKGVFYYVDAVTQGAERLGDRDAVPMLEKLRQVPYLRDQHCRQGYQADYFLERRSMLELGIGRALARCGSASGYDILIDYVSDARSLLAKHAVLELQRLSGRTYGKAAERWRAWLQEEPRPLRTRPLSMRLDIETDSERILRSGNGR